MASVTGARCANAARPSAPDEGGKASAPPLPAGLQAQLQRATQAAGDVARFHLGGLLRTVAMRLTTKPRAVPFATMETEVRDAVLALGRDVLTEIGRLRGIGDRGPAYVCPCGVRLVRKEVAPLQQRTWFGTITLERAVYAGAGCHERAHHVPLDAEWGLLGAVPVPTTLGAPDTPDAPDATDGGTLPPAAPGSGPARLAPAFAAVVVEYGARVPFAEAARLLEAAYGPLARLAPNTIGAYTKAAGRVRAAQEDAVRVRLQPPTRAERQAVFDQPLPERPATAPDTLVITMDGAIERTTAGWKEVKLGAVYDLIARGRQAVASAGRAVATTTTMAMRGATTYTATLAAAPDFGRQLLAVAHRRGLGWAHHVVVLGDGAKWIWKLAARRFPQAVQIVDWYHARAHLWALAQLLYGEYGEGTVAAHAWCETLASELWVAQTAADVAVLACAADEAWATPRKDLPADTPRRTQARRREVTKAVAYFTANATRLRYGAFRAQGLPVGSGVVEGGCQSVLHTRLKRPGACWPVASAEYLARARAVLCSEPTPACSHPWDCLAS